jgi:cell division protein FtsB
METWQVMILKLKLIWTCIKKNWKAALLAVWSIIVWFISRRNSEAAIQAMQANKESYEAQIKSLKDQHKIEVQKRNSC